MEIDELEKRALICAQEYNGIIPYFEAFYIQSIIYSSSRCLESFDTYEYLKENKGTADELICAVQEAVGHAAAVSRYFWPSPQNIKAQPNLKKVKDSRGEKLRVAFRQNENSALFNRNLRNAWEHFDEKLDNYLLENDVGFFFPQCLLDSHNLADDPNGHIFKLLDIDSECLVLLGVKFFFAPLKDAVQDIHRIAVFAEANGSRLAKA